MVRNHTLVFSHGFGVRKDSRGLFTDIAAAFPRAKAVVFDYHIENPDEKATLVRSLTEQAKVLHEAIEKAKQAHPEDIIDLICHSQGCLTAAMLKPEGIRKTVLLAPPARVRAERMIKRFEERHGSELNFEGTSWLRRKNGGLMIFPSQYWRDLRNVEPIRLYNEFAFETELAIVRARQDEILADADFNELTDSITVMGVDGDHNFTGKASRLALAAALQGILSPLPV